MRIFIGTAIFLTSAFCIFLIEGICFRMVEKYAIFRLESSWGTKNSKNFNKYLSFLPINHFAQPPKVSSEIEFSMIRAIEEDKYAAEIMSFGRPQRDDYAEFIKNTDPNRKSFQIKDLNHIRGLMLPGLKRFPSDEEVAKGWAGRQRDQIEYAKALFIDLKPFSTAFSFDEKTDNENRANDYLLEQGIAFLDLPVQGVDSLVSDLRMLKKNYPAVCQKIICRATGKESEILLGSCSSNPFLVNMIIVDCPKGYSKVPQVESAPWFYCMLKKQDLKNITLVDGLLDWVTAARESSYTYPSKIGGLMRIKDNYSAKNLTSFHIPLINQCISFFESLESENARSFELKKTIDKEPTNQNLHRSVNIEALPQALDFSKIKDLQSELPKLESIQSKAFDCKMVREYRKLHENDLTIAQTQNRELILKIGANLEQMGFDVMQEVRKKDPLFYQFYQSLKIIEVQSNDSLK